MLAVRAWKEEKLHRDARERQKQWPEAEKKGEGCRTEALGCRIDLQSKEQPAKRKHWHEEFP